jgi:hypothetical protein
MRKVHLRHGEKFLPAEASPDTLLSLDESLGDMDGDSKGQEWAFMPRANYPPGLADDKMVDRDLFRDQWDDVASTWTSKGGVKWSEESKPSCSQQGHDP